MYRFLHLDYYLNGVERKETIAETDGHGRWFKWLKKRRNQNEEKSPSNRPL